jgi:hypothetical protein
MNKFILKKEDGRIITAVLKIIIDMDGKEGVGIVKKKMNGYLNILLENGNEYDVSKPKYDCEMGNSKDHL